MFQYTAKLIRVIDGDTLLLDVDLGFHVHVEQHVRLAGINCPELSTVEGQAARQEVVRRLDLSGNVVRIETKKDRTEKYGRYLAAVWCKPPGFADTEYSLNLWLVEHGHAEPYNP